MPSPREPFSRLPVVDLQTAAAATSDIYDKLNVLALRLEQMQQAQKSQGQNPPQQTTQQSPSVRTFSLSTTILPTDGTLIGEVRADTSIILPPAASVRNKIFMLTNSPTSTGDLNLQSPSGERVGGVVASSYALLAGQSMTIQSTGSAYIVL